jgi:hypothetical protein
MMNRLFNQLNPLTFDGECEEDRIVIDLMRQQKGLFAELQAENKSIELISLFFEVIEMPTLVEIIKVMIDNNGAKVSELWNILEKPQRLGIWDGLDEDARRELLFGERELLTGEQNRRLWDNMGKARRMSHWQKLGSKETKRDILNLMTNK